MITERPREKQCGLRSSIEGPQRGPRLPCGLLKAVRRLDRELDFVWTDDNWVLYRVFRRGVTPASDGLVKVLKVGRDPGDWVLDVLRRRDLTKNGSKDRDLEQRIFSRMLTEREHRDELEKEKAMDLVGRDVAADVWDHAVHPRKTREVRAPQLKQKAKS